MITCPVCRSPDEVAPVPGPPDEPAGPARSLFQWPWSWSRSWTAAPVVLVVGCCGALQLALTAIAGSGRSLIAMAVVGVFVALAILDRALARSGVVAAAAPRSGWRCRRCACTWRARTPPPLRPGRSGASAVMLRVLEVALTIVLPWRPAALLFAPRHRLAPEDRVVEVLSRIRVVLGLVIVAGVAVWYRSYGPLELTSFLESWLVTGLLAIPACLVCMGLFAAATRAPLRRAVIRQLRWPALSLVAFIATLGLLVLFAEGAGYASGRLEHYAGDAGIPLDGYVYGGVFGLWLLIFCVRSAYLVTQNWFNAVDGHLLLPPVIAAMMAWLVAAKSLVLDGGVDGAPGTVSLVMILGGATATTAIAAIEAWRAARRYGVTLRDGSWPGTVADPARSPL